MARRRYGGYGGYSGGWRPYVSVAERRARARAYARKLAGEGMEISPVEAQGRKITRTFWGDAWCRNLERYSDYANRLPRGRTYVRNGSVIHLGITRGKIAALVSGSEIYRVEIDIARTPPKQWKTLCKECTGQIDSLVDLLRGRLSEGVMERICKPATGLFPAPRQIRLACSCPDWADMCKHVAAVLYGVGCRLDSEPELLFRLRAVDEGQMIAQAAGRVSNSGATPAPRNALADDTSLDEIFGIELAGGGDERPPAQRRARESSSRRATTKAKTKKKATTKKKAAASATTRKKATAKSKAKTRKKATAKKKAPARKKAAANATTRKKATAKSKTAAKAAPGRQKAKTKVKTREAAKAKGRAAPQKKKVTVRKKATPRKKRAAKKAAANKAAAKRPATRKAQAKRRTTKGPS